MGKPFNLEMVSSKGSETRSNPHSIDLPHRSSYVKVHHAQDFPDTCARHQMRQIRQLRLGPDPRSEPRLLRQRTPHRRTGFENLLGRCYCTYPHPVVWLQVGRGRKCQQLSPHRLTFHTFNRLVGYDASGACQVLTAERGPTNIFI